MLDPLTQALLLLWAIAWCMGGCCLAADVDRVNGFVGPGGPPLLAACGPCVWTIALYRQLTRARRAIMRRAGVEGMGCHCGAARHHHSGLDT